MSQTQHITLQKQIRVKENRLDKALVRFNSALATNTKLRTMIDHLRQERSVFEGMHKKLQRVGTCMPVLTMYYTFIYTALGVYSTFMVEF